MISMRVEWMFRKGRILTEDKERELNHGSARMQVQSNVLVPVKTTSTVIELFLVSYLST